MRILCVRDLADGEHLIVSTALTSVQTERERARRYCLY